MDTLLTQRQHQDLWLTKVTAAEQTLQKKMAYNQCVIAKYDSQLQIRLEEMAEVHSLLLEVWGQSDKNFAKHFGFQSQEGYEVPTGFSLQFNHELVICTGQTQNLLLPSSLLTAPSYCVVGTGSCIPRERLGSGAQVWLELDQCFPDEPSWNDVAGAKCIAIYPCALKLYDFHARIADMV